MELLGPRARIPEYSNIGDQVISLLKLDLTIMMVKGYWCIIYEAYEESSENSWYHLICLD